MRKILIIPFIFSFLVTIQCNRPAPSKSLPYFSQKPPDSTPQLLAPDFFSHQKQRIHGFPSFTPDGKQVYWPVIPPQILYMEFKDNVWSTPKKTAFSQTNIQAPFLSTNGQKLYFQLFDSTGYGSLDIWYVEKNDSGWGSKQNLGSPPNSDKMESQPTLTNSGTLYFTGVHEGLTWNRGIFRSRYQNGQYETPELLPETINSKYIDYTPFIAPDESFLLFSSSRPGENEQDQRIYVSFRNENDVWSEPHNLNKIMNFDQTSNFPSLTPDGKYIIFMSKGQYYWVSSKILKDMLKTE